VYTRPENRGKVANSLLAANPRRQPGPVSREWRDQRRLPPVNVGRRKSGAFGTGSWTDTSPLTGKRVSHCLGPGFQIK
jgi:hypothetical protein